MIVSPSLTLQDVAALHARQFPDPERTPEDSALWADYYTVLYAMEALDGALARLDAAGYEECTAPIWSASKDIGHALDEFAEQLRHDTEESNEDDDEENEDDA